VSILPELEQSLAEACRREQASTSRRQPTRRTVPRLGGALIVLASILVVVIGGAALLVLHPAGNRLTSKPELSVATLSPTPQSEKVLLYAASFPYAYAAGGSLYVIRQTKADQPGFQFLRVDPVTGKVLAVVSGGGYFDQALLVHGTLWVTATNHVDSRHSITSLTRHNPDSLARLSAGARLPGSGPAGTAGSLAQAGRWVWVGDWSGIDRFDAVTGSPAGQTAIAGADGAQVATDGTNDSVLLVSEGNERARLQRRDSVLGSWISQTSPILSVSKPFIGGILDGRAWLSNSGGMSGNVSELNATTLQSKTGSRPSQQFTNGVKANIFAGILWITQPDGGPQRNYCANPITGSPRKSLPLRNDAVLLAADERYVYSTTTASAKNALIRTAIPTGCR
jgi:hypothetical protein